MSIINSDGLNTNWQLNVLRGLQSIADNIQSSANINATIVAPLGIRDESESVSVALSSDQWRVLIRGRIIISSGDAPTLIYTNTYSISFASNGTAPALITFDQGLTYESIPPGTTINMDAGGLGNYYPGSYFGYDTQTNAGSSLIITYNE
jgi:hypothetical protein